MTQTTLTSAQLTANLNALYTALGSGVLRAKMPDGSEVEYRSVADIQKAIEQTGDALRQIGSTGVGSKCTLSAHSRGTRSGF